MNHMELTELESKLNEVYKFKYDKDILKDIVMDYRLDDVLNCYKNIIINTSKLTGLNIINELKNELFSVNPEIETKKYNKNCFFCKNSGLITMIDENNYRFVFACNCENGGFKAKNLKLNFWNGKKIQEINNKTFNLEAINE